MIFPDKFPTKGRDPELGEIEWILPDTSEQDIERINASVQKKIDVIEGNI